MADRIHNFNPGPAALPLPVLKEIQENMLNLDGTGMSILEISHRSKAFDRILDEAVARIKRLLKLPEGYHVIFLQGGASTQFFQVPMNFLGPDDKADYLDTGSWSTKAINEAKLLNGHINVAASSKDRNFSYIPKTHNFTPGAVYVHLTSNNTIKGTQWLEYPDTGGVPLVADMSSDIMSRPFDVSPFGLIYAGAQKNLGPAGVTVVIIRQDMVDRVKGNLPSMISYRPHVEKNSTYNTPPCFSIYVVGLVVKWLEESIGGLEAMSRINARKADMIYNLLNSTEFYRATTDKDSRSLMNITFRLASEELEKKFLAEAEANGLGGLKGHRSVGGIRASIYNAVTEAAVSALVDFMTGFAAKNG